MPTFEDPRCEWPAVVRHSATTIGERFTAVRQQWERSWGCENVEVHVSKLAQRKEDRILTFL